jgi:Cupin domain
MRIIGGESSDFSPVTLTGCAGAFTAQIAAARSLAAVSVDFMQVKGPGGGIPPHEGRRDQLCAVLDGHGWFLGVGGEWIEASPGDVVVWVAGETRAWRSETGLLLFSLRARGLSEQIDP